MEQQKQSIHLKGLRLFEVVLISKYLSASDKLCKLALLNHSWHQFSYMHYAWHSFPTKVNPTLLHLYASFLAKFTTLEGVSIPLCHPILLEDQSSFKLLETARSLSISESGASDEFLKKIIGNKVLVSKIESINFNAVVQRDLTDTHTLGDLTGLKKTKFKVNGRNHNLKFPFTKQLQEVELLINYDPDLRAQGSFTFDLSDWESMRSLSLQLQVTYYSYRAVPLQHKYLDQQAKSFFIQLLTNISSKSKLVEFKIKFLSSIDQDFIQAISKFGCSMQCHVQNVISPLSFEDLPYLKLLQISSLDKEVRLAHLPKLKSLSIESNKIEFIKGIHQSLKFQSKCEILLIEGLEQYINNQEITSITANNLALPKLSNFPKSLLSFQAKLSPFNFTQILETLPSLKTLKANTLKSGENLGPLSLHHPLLNSISIGVNQLKSNQMATVRFDIHKGLSNLKQFNFSGSNHQLTLRLTTFLESLYLDNSRNLIIEPDSDSYIKRVEVKNYFGDNLDFLAFSEHASLTMWCMNARITTTLIHLKFLRFSIIHTNQIALLQLILNKAPNLEYLELPVFGSQGRGDATYEIISNSLKQARILDRLIQSKITVIGEKKPLTIRGKTYILPY